jgi:outer membrane immunogenic protein
MGGPRVTAKLRKASFYGHVLFGELTYRISSKGSAESSPFSSSDTSFAMAVGGGADYWLSRRIGVRLVQADYLRNNNTEPGYFAHPGQHANFRISTGVVFRF